MKILYLHQYFKFPNENGGTRSYDLAKGFVKRGIEVEIITTTSDKNLADNKNRWSCIEKEGITINYLYLPYNNSFSALKRIIVFIQFIWFSSIKLLKLKGDLVLATSTPLTIGVPAMIKEIVHKTPYIFEVRDVWPEVVIAIGAIKNKLVQKGLSLLEKIIYIKASAIIPLSTDMRESITTRYPQLVNTPIEVIENISEIDRFQNISKEANDTLLYEKIGFPPRFTVLYAGTFGRVNGIDYVIHLAEKILKIDPTIVFVLIGEGGEKKGIVELAKKKELLNKNIFILEAISKQELPQLYSEVDMGSSFVINIKELWANSANKFFDTLAAGKPILINHKGWQSDVIYNNNLGYVLPETFSQDDVLDFVEYTKNIKLHKEQQDNAINKAKKSYSLNNAVEKYCNVFEKVINK